MLFVLPNSQTRSPCVIDDGDTAVLTGGTRSGHYHRRCVERFDSSGLLENLPNLNLRRGGCSPPSLVEGEVQQGWALRELKYFQHHAAPAILCHKEPARRMQSILVEALEGKNLLAGLRLLA